MSLNLQGMPSETAEKSESSRSRFLEILFIILSAILAALLAALAVVYFVKSRSYNRQIKALSESSFGSNTSEINSNIQRLPLPNTNIFAHEKSNPVMNFSKAPRADLDTQSILSSDSDDFAGLYDSPIFNITNQKDESSVKNPLGQKLENDNNTSSYI